MSVAKEAAALIKEHLAIKSPKTAIILGSGLGGFVAKLKDKKIFKYKDMGNFPESSVEGHRGELIYGTLEGKEIICVNGRVHLYEGHSPTNIAEAIHSLKELGVKQLIVTNAAGSLNKKIAPGSLMLITDHINFSGRNPLVGKNDDDYGTRFPSLNDAYTPRLLEKMKEIAKRKKIKVCEGVYFMVLGPNFETAAEVRMFGQLGGDAVGCSTVPEVIAAKHCSMDVLGISVITNYGAGLMHNTPSHEETLREAAAASDNLIKLLTAFIKEEG
ncbi:MAG: purine-nucleoside phosphorylase [Alphaproteobacteria bacterium]|nr:purine-nucleoside phosphorylase [Alphaproteobacteria bacterium]